MRRFVFLTQYLFCTTVSNSSSNPQHYKLQSSVGLCQNLCSHFRQSFAQDLRSDWSTRCAIVGHHRWHTSFEQSFLSESYCPNFFVHSFMPLNAIQMQFIKLASNEIHHSALSHSILKRSSIDTNMFWFHVPVHFNQLTLTKGVFAVCSGIQISCSHLPVEAMQLVIWHFAMPFWKVILQPVEQDLLWGRNKIVHAFSNKVFYRQRIGFTSWLKSNHNTHSIIDSLQGNSCGLGNLHTIWVIITCSLIFFIRNFEFPAFRHSGPYRQSDTCSVPLSQPWVYISNFVFSSHLLHAASACSLQRFDECISYWLQLKQKSKHLCVACLF